MTKGFSNLNRFVTTLTSTYDKTSTINFMTRGFDDLTNLSDYDKMVWLGLVCLRQQPSEASKIISSRSDFMAVLEKI